jgi:hypothetical protein
MARGGKTLNDREKSARVRDKVLNAIEKVYNGKGGKLSKRQWELTLRMATTVLPRLNEHTGEDGGEIKVKITGMKIIKD